MTTTSDRCRIDPSRPCGACSAPGPDQCPYTYLLADLFTDDHRDEPGGETDPSRVDDADVLEHERG
jgi:hypothetical protein